MKYSISGLLIGSFLCHFSLNGGLNDYTIELNGEQLVKNLWPKHTFTPEKAFAVLEEERDAIEKNKEDNKSQCVIS